MKNIRLLALLMAFMMLVSLFAACGSKKRNESSGTATTAATEATDEGNDLITTAAGETTNTSGGSSSGASSAGNMGSKASIITRSSTPVPSGAPTIAGNKDDENAVLPTIDLSSTNKKLVVCIDWDPKSSWVQAWEKAFRACYDPKKQFTITYKIAVPAMKASKLAVWKSSGSSPDAIYIKPEESWPNLINKGLTQSVDNLVDLSTAFWGSIRNTSNALKIGGKTYALVTSAYAGGWIIYNPKNMKNAGLTDPKDLFYKDQWTWDVFEQYSKKLTKINTTDPTKSKYGVYFHYMEPFLACGGKDLIEYKNGAWKSNLSDATIASEMEFLRKFGDTGNKYALTSEKEMTTIRNMTVNGRVGMYVTAEAPTFEFKDQLQSGEFFFVPIPRLTSSKTYYAAGAVDAFYICAGAKNPKAGAALAAAVRAINVLNLKLDSDNKTPEYTATQQYLQEYTNKTVTVVPMQFRRLSGTIEYWDVYGPVFNDGKSYSALVKEIEPKIMEALKKQ